MADAPEKQAKPTQAPAKDADAAMARVREELQATLKAEASKSLLRSAIDYVTEPYNRSGKAIDQLQELTNNGNAKDFSEKATQAIASNQQAQRREKDSYSIVDGALRSFGNFAPKKLGYVLSGTVSALDEMKSNDLQNITADGLIGLTKGILERRLTSSLGKRELNPTTMALGMGAGNRFVETALTRTNLVDNSGDMTFTSVGAGLLNGAKDAFSPSAMKGDFAAAAIAYPLTKGLSTTFAGNSFRRAATTGFVYGYSQGLVDEFQSNKDGNPFADKEKLEHLALYPLARGVASSIGAMPGGERQYVKDWAWENSVKARNRDYQLVSIAPKDVRAINSARGKTVDVNVSPVNAADMALQPAQSVAIGRQNVPTDWISRAVHAVTMKGIRESGDPQLRYMSRETGNPDAPWQMVTARGFKTLESAAREDPYYKYHRGTPIDKMVPNFKEPLLGLKGHGAESQAFQTAAGPILKFSKISGYGKDFTNWGKLPYDSQTLGDQYHVKPITTDWRGYKGDGKAMYLQEFVNMNGTQKQAAQLREDMAKEGVSFSDFNYSLQGEQVSWATDQFGFRRVEDAPKGQTPKIEPVMVDYGARRKAFNWEQPKTDSEPEAVASEEKPVDEPGKKLNP